jgi:hypothetical protein
MNVAVSFRARNCRKQIFVASATVENLRRRGRFVLRTAGFDCQCMANFQLRCVVMVMEGVTGICGSKDPFKRRWPRRGMYVDATVA